MEIRKSPYEARTVNLATLQCTFRRYLFLIVVVAFLLNFAWEDAQAPLFSGGLSPAHYLIIYTRATLFDALYTVGLYVGIAIIARNRRWVERWNWPHMAFTFVVGFVVAAVIELRALAIDRWSYSESMPLIPYLEVGLSPILQLMVLPYTTFLIVRRIAHNSRN